MVISQSNQDIVRRVLGLLKKKGLSREAACRAAGLGKDTIRDWQRRPDVKPTMKSLTALAEVLNTTPEYLAFRVKSEGSSEQEPGPVGPRILGIVAAGTWREVDSPPDEPRGDAPFALDHRFPADAQYGLTVVGESINRIAMPNDILHCVNIEKAGLQPRENDLVIVERTRAQAGIQETTAKLYVPQSRHIELRPDSDDKAFQSIRVPKGVKKDGEQIAVVAIVIGAYRVLRQV